MDCPKTTKSGEVAVAVRCPPDDSLVEILSRLRAKPLFQFKCVSKTWCGLIADRLRCRKFPQTLEGVFTGGIGKNYGEFVDLSGRPMPFVDPSFSFLTKVPEIEKIVLLDSCNGLVLFGHRRASYRRDDSMGYIVCNPATEQWVAVPREERENEHDFPRNVAVTRLIFDPAFSPHFQLVQFWFEEDMIQLEEVHTFSSVTESWNWRPYYRGTGTQWASDVRIYPIVECPFHGMMHLSVDCPHYKNKKMIVVVDGEGNPSRTICLPDSCASVAFLGQSQGRLHCIGESSGHLAMDGLSTWVLEDYDAEKWILTHSVSYSMLFGRMGCRFKVEWDVVSIHPDRGLVFFVQYCNRKLVSYDMDKKQVSALCTLEHGHGSVIPYVPYFAESALLAKQH